MVRTESTPHQLTARLQESNAQIGLATVSSAGAFLATAFFAGTFLATAFLAGAFLAGVFLTAAFVAATFSVALPIACPTVSSTTSLLTPLFTAFLTAISIFLTAFLRLRSSLVMLRSLDRPSALQVGILHRDSVPSQNIRFAQPLRLACHLMRPSD